MQHYEQFLELGYSKVRQYIPLKQMKKLHYDIEKMSKHLSLSTDESLDAIIIRLERDDKELLYKFYQEINKLFSFMEIGLLFAEFLDLEIKNNSVCQLSGHGILIAPPNNTRLSYKWHQESAYGHPDKTIHFQFPVFRSASIENGTMSVLSRSHHLGRLTYTKNQESQNALLNLNPVDIDNIEKKHDESHFLMELGDFYFFDNNLIHRSNTNYSQNPRFSGVFRINRYDE